MKKLFYIAALVTAFILSALLPALAFAADTAKGEIDFTQIAQGHENILYVALAFLALGAYKLLSKIPLFNQLVTKEQYQKLVDPLLDQAVAYGVGKLKNADWLKLETKNEAVAEAAQYALNHGGDLLKKFGVSEQVLVEKLEAKLVQNGWDTEPGKWDNAG